MATWSGPSPSEVAGAEVYERLLVPGLFLPSTRRAVALAAPQLGERLLDVACGTGIGARMAASALSEEGTAVGVDLDAAMLHVARQAAPDISFLQASALRLPLQDASFDVVLCLQGLQFMADRALALREANRVLRPGGRLVVTAWGPIDTMPGHAAVYAALEANGIDTASPRRGFELDLGTLSELARAAGLCAIEGFVEDDDAVFASPGDFVEGVMQGAPYTRRVLAALPPEIRRACAHAALTRLAGASATDPIALPTRCLLMIAQRDH